MPRLKRTASVSDRARMHTHVRPSLHPFEKVGVDERPGEGGGGAVEPPRSGELSDLNISDHADGERRGLRRV